MLHGQTINSTATSEFPTWLLLNVDVLYYKFIIEGNKQNLTFLLPFFMTLKLIRLHGLVFDLVMNSLHQGSIHSHYILEKKLPF